MTTPTDVGVIGLGIMGGAIARNLAASGHRVIGYDVDGAVARKLAAAGVSAAPDVAAVAATARVILLCLPLGKALTATVDALVKTRPSTGLVVAELSTLALEEKTAARDRLATVGIALLDCPLSGTGAQAATGDLSVLASGDEAAWRSCSHVFADFARVSHYLGPFGNGTKMKFVANLLVAIHNVAAAEAVLLGLRAGLDPATLVSIAGSGAGGSRVLDLRGPMMVKGAFTPATMKMDVWQKDMDLIAAFARQYEVDTPLFRATVPLYAQAISDGLGEADTAAVFQVLAERSGQ